MVGAYAVARMTNSMVFCTTQVESRCTHKTPQEDLLPADEDLCIGHTDPTVRQNDEHRVMT